MKETKPMILEVQVIDGVKTVTVQDPAPDPRMMDEKGVANQIRILNIQLKRIQDKLDYYTQIQSDIQASPSPAEPSVAIDG